MDAILDYLDECCGEESYNVLPDGTIIVADWAFAPLLANIAAANQRYVTRDSEGNYVIAGRNFTTDYPVGVGAVDAGAAASWASVTATRLAQIVGVNRLQKTQHGRQGAKFLTFDFGPGAGRTPVPSSAKIVNILKAFPDALLTAASDGGLRISLPFPADIDGGAEVGSLVGHGAFGTLSDAYGITDVFDRWSGPIALERAGEFAGFLYPRVDSFGYGG